MPADIVELLRLRAFASATQMDGKNAQISKEAANEIERLQKELKWADFSFGQANQMVEALEAKIERLRKALEDIVNTKRDPDFGTPPLATAQRIARAALEAPQERMAKPLEREMTDIVKRLRKEIGGYTDKYLEEAEANMREAAYEIERLREALKPFADVVKGNWSHQTDSMPMSYGFGVDKRFDLTLGDFRKARSALEGK